MARKETRDEAIARANAVERERSILWLALHVLGGKERPDASEVAKVDTWTYRLDLYQVDGAHGGILIVRGSCPGQSVDVNAHYFEEWARTETERAVRMGGEYLAIGQACERLMIARRKAWAETHCAATGSEAA
jgi:hypothetical protein